MNSVVQLAALVARQDEVASEETTTIPLAGTPGFCEGGNEYDGRIGVRISAIFVILFGSTMGAWFPVFAKRRTLGIPEWAFFIAKFFGSGIIIATAFIHLLAPAAEALGNECLTGPITEYPWVEGIALMTIFALFFAEIMTMRYANFNNHEPGHDSEAGRCSHNADHELDKSVLDNNRRNDSTHAPGVDHLGHVRDHTDNADVPNDWRNNAKGIMPENYSAQMTSIFILEFGVIFHSVFIGLTLAVAGEEFITLYVVLVFHQTFEGLGLGSRLAETPWPRSKKWTPYVMAVAYGLSTPLAIAIGLGVRESYLPGSKTSLIVNGVFDSISAGILLYTALVELMAHEFMFSPSMRNAKLSTLLGAFFLMCLGAGLMALLGKWA